MSISSHEFIPIPLRPKLERNESGGVALDGRPEAHVDDLHVRVVYCVKKSASDVKEAPAASGAENLDRNEADVRRRARHDQIVRRYEATDERSVKEIVSPRRRLVVVDASGDRVKDGLDVSNHLKWLASELPVTRVIAASRYGASGGY